MKDRFYLGVGGGHKRDSKGGLAKESLGGHLPLFHGLGKA